MAILKVAKLGHPILRQVAAPIPPDQITGPDIQRLIADMFETMEEYGGVGLAAPQVHQSVRLLITEDIPDPEQEGEFLARRSVAINPEITFLTDEEVAFYEGCLSIPDFRGQVPRIRRIRVRGLDEKGRAFDREIEGFPAVVCQHEIDHLNGVIFLDRMRGLSTLAYQSEFDRFRAASAAGEPS
ncbi:MAG: peptide deformylase [candidate division Zixibacteria bacterium]|nr:peptide deformylase [candidate division Zixibacteria bacterium]